MENFLLTDKEYRYIRKHKLNFETRYHVKLILPEIDENKSGYCANDIIFATIYGEKQNIRIVKDQMKLKAEEFKINQDCLMSSSNVGENVPVITLSDSDSDNPIITALCENKKVKKHRKKKRTRNSFSRVAVPSVSSTTEASSNCNPCSKRKLSDTVSTTELIPINITSEENCTDDIQEIGNHKKFKGPLVSVNESPIIIKETIATSSKVSSQNANDSVVLLDEWGPIDEFIPLNSKINKIIHNRKNKNRNKKKIKNTKKPNNDDSVVILDKDDVIPVDEIAVPRPIPKDPKLLRPIIIDGSNVARAHGKSLHTFSCKGIQISVDYFLKRGHTQITVFVPHYRRYKTTGAFPTTDPIILEDLEKCQRLVFTPSRNINGKRMSCYDDRFIVELASTTNGVILSNDNYRDLLEEKDFKKTIEERLLMFVFVGDMIMIPNDPLGRNGPCLDDFLSLPSNNY